MIQIVIYLAVAGFRIWALRLRLNAPLQHGERYFLDVPVESGFYAGPGRALLWRYRVLVLLPFAVELCVFGSLVAAGKTGWLPLLLGVGGMTDAAATLVVGQVLRRSARRYQDAGIQDRPARVALSLRTRRLAGYTSRRVEWAMAAVNAVSLVLVADFYASSNRGFRSVWAMPILALYFQAGALLAKRALVDWRTAAPADAAERYLEHRERARKFFMRICDLLRGHATIFLASYTALVLLGDAQNDLRVRLAVLSPWMIFTAVTSGMLISQSNRLANASRDVAPVNMSRPRRSEVRGLAYYEPDDPSVIARSRLGVALNLANGRAVLYLCYAGGLVAIVAVLSRLQA